MNQAAPARLLVLPGSSRTGSLNMTLARAACRMAEGHGATVRLLDLRTLALPVYDGDIEAGQGVPAQAGELVDAIVAADAVLIVTPEYNGFPTPLVINAFDWISRASNDINDYRPLAAAGILLLMMLLLAMNGVAIWLRNRYEQKW